MLSEAESKTALKPLAISLSDTILSVISLILID